LRGGKEKKSTLHELRGSDTTSQGGHSFTKTHVRKLTDSCKRSSGRGKGETRCGVGCVADPLGFKDYDSLASKAGKGKDRVNLKSGEIAQIRRGVRVKRKSLNRVS